MGNPLDGMQERLSPGAVGFPHLLPEQVISGYEPKAKSPLDIMCRSMRVTAFPKLEL
ncbi:MAG: hypothetical protein ABW216_04770 [Candidatus Rokuibacteriota bacterium]